MTLANTPLTTMANPAQFAAAALPPEAHGCLDGVDLEALASQVPTPLHVYSRGAISQRIDALQSALQGLDAMVCYAVKANANQAILQHMQGAGIGADIVSVGELKRCLHAGMVASRIVFSGVGKTAQEIADAMQAGIARFNVESVDELHTIERVAAEQGVVAHAAVRINPDVDAHTHAKISTGKAENKFGVAMDAARDWFANATQWPHVRLDGLHVHIGSQIQQLAPFAAALERLAMFWRELERDGHVISSIDVGGGLGVRYQHDDCPPSAPEYVAVIRRALQGYAGRIVLEPGRWLVAEAGVLLTRVIRVKHGAARKFLVLDAAMNDFMRPSLYEAWHDIVPVRSDHDRAPVTYDIVGPVCESGDTFARDRVLPECRAGDLLMIKATGAYGASMASTYNSRPLAAEVLLDNGRYAIVRRAQSFEEMTAGEQPATHWLRPVTL